MRIEIPDDVEPMAFINTSIGSPRLRAMKETIGTVVFMNDSSLSPREREGARAFLAQMVDCNACNTFRAGRDIPGYSDEPIEDAFYDHISKYHSWPGYTTRERLVIEFCARFHTDHRGLAADDELWDRLHANFSPIEVQDLCILAGIMDMTGKLREVLLGVGETACAIRSGT